MSADRGPGELQCAGRCDARHKVIVRQTGAEWWAADGDHWVRTPDGRLWNPADEARRCFAGHGSLRLLCRDATSAARVR